MHSKDELDATSLDYMLEYTDDRLHYELECGA